MSSKTKVLLIQRFAELDFELIKRHLAENYPETKVIHIHNTKNNLFIFIINQLKIFWHLIRSEGCVIDSFVLPIGLPKLGKKTTVIQMWHALGAIKKFGYTALDTEEGVTAKQAKLFRMHKGYDYICAGGPATIKAFAESFGVNKEKVLPLGMPRADYLKDKSIQKRVKEKLYRLYPQLNNGLPNILYAPTYRKSGENGLMELVKNYDHTKSNLIVKLHPLTNINLSDIPEYVLVDSEFTTIDWLMDTDVLVSDYSAVCIEASILDISTIFYVFDLDQYSKDRGLFLNFEDRSINLPGSVTKNSKDVFNYALNGKFSSKKLSLFKASYCPSDKQNSTKAIIDLLFI